MLTHFLVALLSFYMLCSALLKYSLSHLAVLRNPEAAEREMQVMEKIIQDSSESLIAYYHHHHHHSLTHSLTHTLTD
jgi:hypothetical protein